MLTGSLHLVSKRSECTKKNEFRKAWLVGIFIYSTKEGRDRIVGYHLSFQYTKVKYFRQWSLRSEKTNKIRKDSGAG